MEKDIMIKKSRFRCGDEVGVDVQLGKIGAVSTTQNGTYLYDITTPNGNLLNVPEQYVLEILKNEGETI